jgi:hypothetical protein
MNRRIMFSLSALLLVSGLAAYVHHNYTTRQSVVPAVSAAVPPEATSPKPSPLGPEIGIPSGTILRVRLDQELDTERNRTGDRFSAILDAPVVVSGQVVIPRGTRFRGHVTSAQSGGRLKGRASLAVRLDSFELGGKTYAVDTSPRARASGSHKRRNGELIGGGSGVGALVGGIAGGGEGLLIGAGAGAAAGTIGAVVTGKKQVHIPAETILSFTLRDPVRV